MSRNHGHGSVYQRKSDGRWCAAFVDPQTGKRAVRYADTEKAAKRLLRDMTSRADAGSVVKDARTTVRAFVRWWIDNRAGRSRKESTVTVYESRLRCHVVPRIGSLRLGEVTVLHVEAMLDDMHADGSSNYVLRDVKIALSAMFADAVRARLLRANPAELAQLPETTTPLTRRTAPATADVKRLLTETKGSELGNLVSVMAFTGCRVGEALAAEWADMDLAAGTWRIWRTVTRTRQGGYILGTSTKTGRERLIALPGPLVDILRDQRAKVAAKRLAAHRWETHLDLVFPSPVGTILDSKVARAELHATAPWWPGTFHVLRHWAASAAITDGEIPIATVSKLLGHSKVSTTSDTYGHLLPESATEVSQAITRALGQS